MDRLAGQYLVREEQRLLRLCLVERRAAAAGDDVREPVSGDAVLEVMVVAAEHDLGLVGEEGVQQLPHLARPEPPGLGGVGPDVGGDEDVLDIVVLARGRQHLLDPVVLLHVEAVLGELLGQQADDEVVDLDVSVQHEEHRVAVLEAVVGLLAALRDDEVLLEEVGLALVLLVVADRGEDRVCGEQRLLDLEERRPVVLDLARRDHVAGVHDEVDVLLRQDGVHNGLVLLVLAAVVAVHDKPERLARLYRRLERPTAEGLGPSAEHLIGVGGAGLQPGDLDLVDHRRLGGVDDDRVAASGGGQLDVAARGRVHLPHHYDAGSGHRAEHGPLGQPERACPRRAADDDQERQAAREIR